MFDRVPLHLALVALVFIGLGWALPGASALVWLTLIVAVLHQTWVLVWWRLELHGKRVSGRLGHPLGFRVYQVGFALFALVRVTTIWALAWSEPGGLGLPEGLRAPLALAMLAVGAALMVSIRLTFGMARAFGLDHWEPERHRGLGFVRRGLHRLTPNAMYVFAPSLLLAPVFWWDSWAALLATLANWTALWVHYHCTETPDMARIYGPVAP